MNNVDHYIESVDDDMRPIVEALRDMVIDVSSDFVEEIKWNVPTYSINKMICSIMAHKNHVNLQFFQGAKIQNVASLVGTGKDMRHIKFSHLYDLNAPEIRKAIEEAIKIDT